MPCSNADGTADRAGEMPTAVVTVDREAAAQRGMSEEAVVGMHAQQMFPSPVGQVTIGDGELDIYLEQGDSVETLEELQDLQIAGFPLTDVEIGRAHV